MKLIIVTSYGKSEQIPIDHISIAESASDNSKIVISYKDENKYLRKDTIKQIIIEP